MRTTFLFRRSFFLFYYLVRTTFLFRRSFFLFYYLVRTTFFYFVCRFFFSIISCARLFLFRRSIFLFYYLVRTTFFPYNPTLHIKRRALSPVHTREPINTALSRSLKMYGSAMSGPWSGRSSVCWSKIQRGWSGPLWEVVVSRISFSTGRIMVEDDPALHRSYVERGYSVMVGGTA